MLNKQEVLKLISSYIRLNILTLLNQKSLTISELHKKIKYPNGVFKKIKYPNGVLFDYKAIHRQANLLQKKGLIKLKKEKKRQGRPVVAELIKKPDLDYSDKDILFWWNTLIIKS